jgi:hypothetical protein
MPGFARPWRISRDFSSSGHANCSLSSSTSVAPKWTRTSARQNWRNDTHVRIGSGERRRSGAPPRSVRRVGTVVGRAASRNEVTRSISRPRYSRKARPRWLGRSSGPPSEAHAESRLRSVRQCRCSSSMKTEPAESSRAGKNATYARPEMSCASSLVASEVNRTPEAKELVRLVDVRSQEQTRNVQRPNGYVSGRSRLGASRVLGSGSTACVSSNQTSSSN